MNASPLAKLPRELRDAIWELVLYNPDGVNLCVCLADPKSFISGVKVHHTNAKQALALTRTCKQIRFETGTLSYAKNEFTMIEHFLEDISMTSFVEGHARITKLCVAWLRSVGMKNSLAISKLVLHVKRTNDFLAPAFKMEEHLDHNRHRRRDHGLRRVSSLLPPSCLCTRVTQEVWPSFRDDYISLRADNGRLDFHQVICPHLSVNSQLLSEITHDVSSFDDAQACKDIVDNYKARVRELELHQDHQDCQVAKLLRSMPEGIHWPCCDMLQAMGLWQGHKTRNGIGHPVEMLNGA